MCWYSQISLIQYMLKCKNLVDFANIIWLNRFDKNVSIFLQCFIRHNAWNLWSKENLPRLLEPFTVYNQEKGSYLIWWVK